MTAFSSLRSEKKNKKIVPKTATLYDLAEELEHTAEKAQRNLNHESMSESTVLENQEFEYKSGNGEEQLYHLNTQKRFILEGNDDYLDYDFHQRKSKEIRRLQYSAGIYDKNKFFVHNRSNSESESSSSSSLELEILEGSEELKKIEKEISQIEIEIDSSSELDLSSKEENEEKECFVINIKDIIKPDETKNISTQEGTQIEMEEILKDLSENLQNLQNKKINDIDNDTRGLIPDYQEYRVEFRKGEEEFLEGTEVKLWPMETGMPFKRGFIVKKNEQEIKLRVDIVVESLDNNQRIYVKFEKDTDIAKKISEENFENFQNIFESEYDSYNLVKETPDTKYKIDRFRKHDDVPLSKNMFIKKVEIENKNCKIFDSCDDHIGDGRYTLIDKNDQEVIYYQAVYVYESESPQNCFLGVLKNSENSENLEKNGKLYLRKNNLETLETVLKQGKSNLGDGRCQTTYIKMQSTSEEPGLRYIFFVKKCPLKRPEINIDDKRCKLLGDNGETYIGPYGKEDEFSFRLMTSSRGEFILVEPYEEEQKDAENCLKSVFRSLQEKRDQKLREEEERRQLAILKEALDKQEMIDLFNTQSKENPDEINQKIQNFRNDWELNIVENRSSVVLNRLRNHFLFDIQNAIEARRRIKRSKKKTKNLENIEIRDSSKQIELKFQSHNINRDSRISFNICKTLQIISQKTILPKVKKSKKSKKIIFKNEFIPSPVHPSRPKKSKRNTSNYYSDEKESLKSIPENKFSFPKTPKKRVLPIKPEQQVFRSISNSRRRSKAPISTIKVEPENAIKNIQKQIIVAPKPQLSYFTAIQEMGRHKCHEFEVIKIVPKTAKFVNPKVKVLTFLKQVKIEPESSEKKVELEDREIHTVPIHRLKRWSPGIQLSPGKMNRNPSFSKSPKKYEKNENFKIENMMDNNNTMAIKVLKKAKKINKITKKLAYVSQNVPQKKRDFSSEKKKKNNLDEIRKLRKIENNVTYTLILTLIRLL